MRAALIFTLVCCAARAQDSQNDWQKPEQVLRALSLKRSDAVAVLEPEAFLAPLISNRVRVVGGMDAPAHSADVVVLYDVLHGMDQRAQFYAKLHRVLQFGGRIVNIDFSSDPPGTVPSKSKLTEAQAADEFKAAGFRITQTISSLPYQYIQVFQ
ncbi:MAG: methyltransferase domain-containing protein [Bryobacterales bacterium]|nr:methyltransferase domain-containing protein [Bryobacterales bacterium]